MLTTIIWLIGTICTVWCVLDLFKKPIGIIGKLIVGIFLLCTSWLGLALYYFWIREKVTSWFK